MKNSIHPEYNTTKITCNSCRKVYTLGSTTDSLKVELCSNCHPFYTGKQVLVDTDNLVDKFNKKTELASKQSKQVKTKKEKNERRRSTEVRQTLTLKDMLSNLK
jgi:large subunit ribosomal protein L31